MKVLQRGERNYKQRSSAYQTNNNYNPQAQRQAPVYPKAAKGSALEKAEQAMAAKIQARRQQQQVTYCEEPVPRITEEDEYASEVTRLYD